MFEIYVGDLVLEKLLFDSELCSKQVQHIQLCQYASGLPGATRASADQTKEAPIQYSTATQVGLQKITQLQRSANKSKIILTSK